MNDIKFSEPTDVEGSKKFDQIGEALETVRIKNDETIKQRNLELQLQITRASQLLDICVLALQRIANPNSVLAGTMSQDIATGALKEIGYE